MHSRLAMIGVWTASIFMLVHLVVADHCHHEMELDCTSMPSTHHHDQLPKECKVEDLATALHLTQKGKQRKALHPLPAKFHTKQHQLCHTAVAVLSVLHNTALTCTARQDQTVWEPRWHRLLVAATTPLRAPPCQPLYTHIYMV